MISRYLQAIDNITAWIGARCVRVSEVELATDGFRKLKSVTYDDVLNNSVVVDGMEVVQVTGYRGILVAPPAIARVFRLWHGGRIADAPVRWMLRLGFLRATDPFAYDARWSYPLRPVDVRGYALDWEMRVLAWFRPHRHHVPTADLFG